MKRISLLALFTCALITQSVEAWSYYTPLHYRPRYSPYALSGNNSGIVPGDTRYSLYQVSKERSGLAPYSLRYSMYAFGTKSNGMIYDNGYDDHGLGYWASPVCEPIPTCVDDETACVSTAPAVYFSRGTHYRQRAVGWNRPSRLCQKRILLAALEARCPGKYRVTRSMCIGHEYVSFDVVLEGTNTVLKYWNPALITSIQDTSSIAGKQYQSYVASWQNFCEQHEKKGGKMYHISSNDADQVIAELDRYLNEVKFQSLPLPGTSLYAAK